MKNKSLSLIILSSFLMCCAQSERLPILGETTMDQETGEIVYYKAPEFQLTNQLNATVSNTDFEGRIQVVDFFFSRCPSICPQMTKHLKLVQDHFENEKKVSIISYSIDPLHDTSEVLYDYAKDYDIDNRQWALLTGNSNTILELSKDYKVRAFNNDSGEDGNLIHDGTFVLVDPQRRIRGYYDGLDKEDTKRLIHDITLLLKE